MNMKLFSHRSEIQCFQLLQQTVYSQHPLSSQLCFQMTGLFSRYCLTPRLIEALPQPCLPARNCLISPVRGSHNVNGKTVNMSSVTCTEKKVVHRLAIYFKYQLRHPLRRHVDLLVEYVLRILAGRMQRGLPSLFRVLPLQPSRNWYCLYLQLLGLVTP